MVIILCKYRVFWCFQIIFCCIKNFHRPHVLWQILVILFVSGSCGVTKFHIYVCVPTGMLGALTFQNMLVFFWMSHWCHVSNQRGGMARSTRSMTCQHWQHKFTYFYHGLMEDAGQRCNFLRSYTSFPHATGFINDGRLLLYVGFCICHVLKFENVNCSLEKIIFLINDMFSDQKTLFQFH